MKKFLVLLAMAGFANFAMASSCGTSGSSITLIDETDPGGTISVGNVFAGSSSSCTYLGETFSNFTITPGTGYTSGSTNVSVALVLEPSGIDFNIAQGSGQDIDITYAVSPGFSGVTLSLVIPSIGTEVGSVNESVCVNSSGCGSPFTGSVDDISPVTGPVTDLISGITPGGTDYISKDVNTTSNVYQGIVPEPATLGLMGAGLLGLGFLGRRKFGRK